MLLRLGGWSVDVPYRLPLNSLGGSAKAAVVDDAPGLLRLYIKYGVGDVSVRSTACIRSGPRQIHAIDSDLIFDSPVIAVEAGTIAGPTATPGVSWAPTQGHCIVERGAT